MAALHQQQPALLCAALLPPIIRLEELVSCSPFCRHGVRISLGFFEDVRIPVSLLPQPARWQASDAEWSWLGGGPTPLYFQRGKEIRFKVRAVWFHPEPTRATQNAQAAAGELVEGTAERPHVPMEVQARADTVGLGMTFWEWGDT